LDLPQHSPNQKPPVEVSRVVEHLFRHESGKMVSILTGIFGVAHLNLAEDVVQEALIRALQTWPFHGIPENPSAWIMRASRNLALDVVRREKVFRDKQGEIIRLMEQRNAPDLDELIFSEQEIADDRLRMMFVCCHPSIPPEDQVALTLKTLCGFSPMEIAHAFLTTEVAVAKRLTRTRQKIREAQIPFEIPSGEDLARRLGGVLRSIYLLFNEGYKASSGDRLVKEEICNEAIRMADLLTRNPLCNQPGTHGLLSLMLLNAARLPARADAEGNLLRLQEQDRTRWSQPMIARGMFHLAQSSAGPELNEYHLQAAIAACHAAAKDYAATDWGRILQLYEHLTQLDPSPVAALNRAVALAEVRGPQAGIDAVRAIPNLRALQGYYLLPSVLGEFELRLSHFQAAAGHFREALGLADLKSEQAFLEKKLAFCHAQIEELK
jgi:RNA polymerase sigma-70 factor (ECF subfamily)